MLLSYTCYLERKHTLLKGCCIHGKDFKLIWIGQLVFVLKNITKDSNNQVNLPAFSKWSKPQLHIPMSLFFCKFSFQYHFINWLKTAPTEMENVLDLMSVGTQAYNSLSPLKFPFDRFVTMQLSFRNRVLRHRPLRSYCTSRIQLLTMTYATMILAHLWTFKCIMHVQYNT